MEWTCWLALALHLHAAVVISSRLGAVGSMAAFRVVGHLRAAVEGGMR